MTREEFIKYLKTQKGKTVILELKGIINTKLKIKEMQIKFEKGYLTLLSKESEFQEIKLNLHQLIRVKKLEENKILLEFDQLQSVTIEIKLFI